MGVVRVGGVVGVGEVGVRVGLVVGVGVGGGECNWWGWGGEGSSALLVKVIV